MLRKKIAQMICIGFEGNRFEDASALQAWLAESEGLGALILFDYDLAKQRYPKNIVNLEQLGQLNKDIKAYYNQYHSNDLPLWLAIDVEGGFVDRLAKIPDYPKLPSAAAMAQLTAESRKAYWRSSAVLLKGLGFDLNFSPVVDLDLSKQEGIFGPLQRCFSDDPKRVTELAAEYIDILNQEKLHACIKHFPGHGSAKQDSHHDFVDVTDTYVLDELEPFRQLIARESSVDCIMTAHVINKNLDATGLPATLSAKLLNDLLRQEMHFKGLIISDDLQMHAIAKHFSREEALMRSINAGADMIIFGNQLGWDEPAEVINCIEGLVHQGLIAEEKINQAYQRIQAIKLKNLG